MKQDLNQRHDLTQKFLIHWPNPADPVTPPNPVVDHFKNQIHWQEFQTTFNGLIYNTP